MAADTVGAIPSSRPSPTEASFPTAAFRGLFAACVAALVVCPAATAWAQEDDPAEAGEEQDSNALDSSLSLDPATPSQAALPGGMTPAFGNPAAGRGDWRFDFHGQFTMPMVAGLNSRANRESDESKYVMHAPPQIPGDKETFSYTTVTPTPFVQMNLSYGNSIVTGTVTIKAEQATISTGFFDPPSQAGVNDVFLQVRPQLGDQIRMQLYFGAFSNRYGSPGEYDEGRYGTPIIAATNGVGEAVVTTLRLANDWTLLVEQGILGQSSRAPADLTPDIWNGFADSNVGASFLHHEHAGIAFRRAATLGLHYMHAWSQDDQATGRLAPDGKIQVAGGDLRLNLGRFGHFYTAAAYTNAENARTVGRIIEVLNTEGGPGLIENYLGEASDGNGSLMTFGGQYDLSVGKLVSYPVPFNGDGPDIVVSLFGLGTQVTSDDPDEDGQLKLKFGAEAGYSLLSWFAASARLDEVYPNMDEAKEAFVIVSPRLIFRTDWQSTNQVVLQYSRFINGSLTTVRTGYPPREDLSAIPDENVVSLSASMWW